MSLSNSEKAKLIEHGRFRRKIIHKGAKKIVEFPEISGEIFPWYTVEYGHFSERLNIYNPIGEHKGFIESTGRLVMVTFENGRRTAKTNKIFDFTTRNGILQAVRYTFLLTQEPVSLDKQ